MSNTVENAMLEHLITELKLRNVRQIECVLKKTRHNIPIHNLLEKFNFKILSNSESEKLYISDIDKLDSKNKFIRFI
jgi:predicted enzyme involved in methoxymalonyl-ACP biosynthesis